MYAGAFENVVRDPTIRENDTDESYFKKPTFCTKMHFKTFTY